MSKLLIQESPLQFQPSLAVAIGINEAIVLQQIHYWISNPKNKGYEQDGYKWVYNTYAEWKETNFPFWSENTIQRVFASLEEKGLVVSIQPMKSRYDRTKYYRIDYTKLDGIEDTKMTPIDDPNLVSSLDESETTTEKTKDFSLSEEEIHQANAKVDYIIEANKQPDNYYQGRELIRENLLIYADWYNKVSGQVMTKRVQKDWWKTLDIWREEGLTLPDLQTAWDNRIAWRKNITSPSELTNDAVAIKAAGKAAPKTDPKERATILRTL